MRRGAMLVAAMLWQGAQAAEPPAPPLNIHARYVVIKSGIEVAEIDEVYARNNDRYTLTSTARPLGIMALIRPGKIRIRSSGLIDAQGLKPLQFSDQREGASNKDSAARFIWERHQLSLDHDGLNASLALPRGTQDRLSAMYQFMFIDLRAQQSVAFPMTNGSKLDHYHYTVAQGGSITTPAGQFNTWYLDSQAKTGETRSQLWLASTRYNVPCKLIITDPDGGKLTQELRTLDIQP